MASPSGCLAGIRRAAYTHTYSRLRFPSHPLEPENWQMRTRLFALAAALAAAACGGADAKKGGPLPPKADAPSAAGQHDWPQWQGVVRTNTSTETGLLKDWPKD